MPLCCNQVENARRVCASNVERIWSSWTVGAICVRGIVPPSASFGPFCEPGDSSMYVSPSSDFWRRIACVSAGRGAYWRSIWKTAFVRPVWRSSETETTLPTLTPEIRTSDSCASCTA